MTMKTYLALALLITVLAGNAYGENGVEENKSDADIESTIKTVTASLSPVMLPMIYSLGEISEEKD